MPFGSLEDFKNTLIKSRYEAAAKHFNPGDLDVNLSGRSFVITGANSGVGKATAHKIAKIGGTVHLVCRNKGRAEEVCTLNKHHTHLFMPSDCLVRDEEPLSGV